MQDCKAVVAALREQHGASALGAQGFCWGGLYTALLLAGAGARRLAPCTDPTRPPTPAACPLLLLRWMPHGDVAASACRGALRSAPCGVGAGLWSHALPLRRRPPPCLGTGGCVHLARPGRPGEASYTRAGRATVSTCAVPDRDRSARRVDQSTRSSALPGAKYRGASSSGSPRASLRVVPGGCALTRPRWRMVRQRRH